jgi:hypothetical protein
MSEIDNKLKSKAEYVVNNSSYATDPFVFSAKLVPGGGVTEKWKVQSIDLQPERTILFYNESQSDNIYAIFWNMNITAEKIYSSQNRDGYALNDVENFDIYILTYTSGIVEENRKINSENLQIYSEAYGNSLFGNYIVLGYSIFYDGVYTTWYNSTIVDSVGINTNGIWMVVQSDLIKSQPVDIVLVKIS